MNLINAWLLAVAQGQEGTTTEKTILCLCGLSSVILLSKSFLSFFLPRAPLPSLCRGAARARYSSATATLCHRWTWWRGWRLRDWAHWRPRHGWRSCCIRYSLLSTHAFSISLAKPPRFLFYSLRHFIERVVDISDEVGLCKWLSCDWGLRPS